MAKDAVVRAIDVGYGNTKLVIGEDGQSIRCMHFPSITPVSDEAGATDALGTRRKTVAIPIGGGPYAIAQGYAYEDEEALRTQSTQLEESNPEDPDEDLGSASLSLACHGYNPSRGKGHQY